MKGGGFGKKVGENEWFDTLIVLLQVFPREISMSLDLASQGCMRSLCYIYAISEFLVLFLC